MKEQAIAKLQAEMEAEKSNPNLQGAGLMLTQYMQSHPEAAAGVMTEGATLKKACQALHDEAKRRAGGKGSFWMSDADGFAFILEYFGIKAAGAPGTADIADTAHAAGAFNVDLDALLGL